MNEESWNEGSVKNPSDNATASLYYFINLYYVLRRKVIKYKKTFVTKGQVHKDLKTGPLSQNRIIHGITNFRHVLVTARFSSYFLDLIIFLIYKYFSGF